MSTLDTFKGQIEKFVRRIASGETTDYEAFVELLDDFEMEPSISTTDYTEEFGVLHLLSYLLIWDAINAKFLWKRLNERMKISIRLKSLFGVFADILANDIKRIVKDLEAALNDYKEETIVLLSHRVVDSTRAHVSSLVATHYVNMPLRDFAYALNLKEEETRAYIALLSWKIIEGDFVEPDKKTKLSDDILRTISFEQIEQATKTIGFLETI